MSAYLQRLYDAAVSADAHPAQRSASPLLAVDQRLATTAYSTSYLGLPGPAESRPGGESGPARPAVPRFQRWETALRGEIHDASVRDETSVWVLPPRPASRHIPAPGTEHRVGPVSRPDIEGKARPVPAPTIEPRIRDTDGPPEAHSWPLGEDIKPARAAHSDREAAEPLAQVRQPANPAQPLDWPRSLVSPPGGSGPNSVPATSDVAPVPAARTAKDQVAGSAIGPSAPAAAPVPLRPIPATAPNPLPPPASPRPADLAAQVRRLVRAELSTGAAPQPRVPEPGAQGVDANTPAPRPSTAEAMSVIGPLERPARSTMLFGLRLR